MAAPQDPGPPDEPEPEASEEPELAAPDGSDAEEPESEADGSEADGSEADGSEADVVEIPAGIELGTLEVVMARFRADGIPARIEPDLTGVIPDETDGGYRILLRRDDLEAARPVLETAEIAVPPEIL